MYTVPLRWENILRLFNLEILGSAYNKILSYPGNPSSYSYILNMVKFWSYNKCSIALRIKFKVKCNRNRKGKTEDSINWIEI